MSAPQLDMHDFPLGFGVLESVPSIELRDYLAAHALQPILAAMLADAKARQYSPNAMTRLCADSAYIVADHMLAAREAKP